MLQGTVLSTMPGPVRARDQDAGINAPLHYSLTGEGGALLSVDKDTGAVAATRQLLAAVPPVTVVLKVTDTYIHTYTYTHNHHPTFYLKLCCMNAHIWPL